MRAVAGTEEFMMTLAQKMLYIFVLTHIMNTFPEEGRVPRR